MKTVRATALLSVGLLPSLAGANMAATVDAINALSNRSAYQVNDILLVSELQRQAQTASNVQQGQLVLASELADTDGDNTLESPGMRPTLTGYTPPAGGGFIPTSSMAAKTDGYGMPIGYCAWDNGTATGSGSHIAGDNPVTNGSVSLVVLSSGKDRVFNTSCADARIGSYNGDDVASMLTVGQGNYGANASAYIGRPVADAAALFALDTSMTQPGEIRMVLDEGITYSWLDLNGDGTFQWEGAASKSYFYSGDSNGATAGGEYSSTPFGVGIGAKFTDTNVVPSEMLEVDGNAMVSNGNDADTVLTIESDPDNLGSEEDNPRLHLRQDGGGIQANFGLTGTADLEYNQSLVNAAYLEIAESAANTGSLQFVTGRDNDLAGSKGTARMTILADGKIGIGTNAPLSRMTLSGADDAIDGPVMTLHGTNSNQFESGRIRLTESNGMYSGGFIHYEGNTATGGTLNIGVHNSPGTNTANDKNVLSIIRSTGYVGLNNSDPAETLHIRSANGDGAKTEIIIEADPGNADDTISPNLHLMQDGGQTHGYFGLEGTAGSTYVDSIANATYFEGANTNADSPIQFVTGRDSDLGGSQGAARMTILSDGKIGIGSSTPSSTLFVSGADDPSTGPVIEFRGTTENQFENGRIRFTENNTNFLGGYLHYDGIANVVSLGVNNDNTGKNTSSDNPALNIVRATGRVGVGTITPSHLLDVAGNAGVKDNFYVAGTGAIRAAFLDHEDGKDIQFGTDNSADPALKFYRRDHTLRPGQTILTMGENAGSKMMFGKEAGGNLVTPYMTILDGGNVGIGTETPTSLLDVAGTTKTDRLEVGASGDSAEFCLNGRCTQEVRGVKRAQVTLNDATYTPIAYIEGTELGSSVELQINGTATNKVVNVRADIMAGHQHDILIESASLGYTQLSLYVQLDSHDHWIISGRLLNDTGTLTTDVQVVAKNDDTVVMNPTNTIVVEQDLFHYTYANATNVSSTSSESMMNNGRPVVNVTGTNVKFEAPDNLAPGWYTIATNIGNRATARFAVVSRESGRHQSAVFYATTLYGKGSSINVLTANNYNVWQFDDLRIVEGSTYDGAMLQVRVTDATNNFDVYMLGDNFWTTGWELKNWVPDGTDPGGLNNYAAVNTPAVSVHVPTLPDGGMFASGGLNIGTNTLWGKGRSFDNDNRGAALTFGGGRTESFAIFRQHTYEDGTTATECGGSFNDCYVFHMTDSNSANPDGSILFGATGSDDVFEKYLTIDGSGRISITPSTAASLSNATSALNIETIHGRATMGARNGTYFHLDTGTSSGFYFYDRVTSAVGFTTASDRRFKKNITEVDGALSKLGKIRGVTYDWKLDEFSDRGFEEGKQYGVIAQELESVFPEMVHNSDDGYKTVNYTSLIPVLVQASNELNSKVDNVETKADQNTARITDLEGEVRTYKSQILALQSELQAKSEGGSSTASAESQPERAIDMLIQDQPKDAQRTKQSTSALSRFYQ